MQSLRVLTWIAVWAVATGVATPPDLRADETDRVFDCESRFVAALRRLPEAELKAYYLQCSRAAMQRVLDSQEIALCSIGYEILLQKVFGGDFSALLAWSRTQPSDGVAVARSGRGPFD
jgi:hypothetical protein